MDVVNLNSFSSFVDDSTLSDNDIITRNLSNFLIKNVGSEFFSRDKGPSIASVENTENSTFYDGLLKVQIVQAVGKYNLQTVERYQAIVGSDMIDIMREENYVAILVVFIPLRRPNPKDIDSFILNIPSFGG